MPIALNWMEVIKMGEWGGTPWPIPSFVYLPVGQNTLGRNTLGM